jgi:hypothetical protein
VQEEMNKTFEKKQLMIDAYRKEEDTYYEQQDQIATIMWMTEIKQRLERKEKYRLEREEEEKLLAQFHKYQNELG